MNISEFTEQHLQYTTPNYSANATGPKITSDGCCIGYFMSPENNKCEKCIPGYIGLNCSEKCPFPFYGENCKDMCNCSNETCDVSTGCWGLTSLTTDTMITKLVLFGVIIVWRHDVALTTPLLQFNRRHCTSMVQQFITEQISTFLEGCDLGHSYHLENNLSKCYRQPMT